MHNYRFDIIPKTPKKSHLSEYLVKLSNDTDAKIYKSKIYWLRSEHALDHFDLEYISLEILANKNLELAQFSENTIPFKYDQFIQVSFKPGVRDNRAQATHDAIQIFYPEMNFDLHTGDGYFIHGDIKNDIISYFAHNYLINPLLNNLKISLRHDFENKRFHNIQFPKVELEKENDEIIDLNLTDEELLNLSEKRCLALTLNEMQQIRNYISDNQNERFSLGLHGINEVELEILAQTWSEHCKHKIFAANIEYSEADHPYVKLPQKKINSLYKEYIKNTTKEINKDWLISVFSDNAGVVRFDAKYDLCIKVETHNSPCALDPYGGALTGILGVNRDIIGTGLGARPIGNMDVFCIGEKEADETLPPKLLHPKRMLKEVHKGVMDGGNKSGIPTLNGSMHFHRNWLGKPLIYVGSIGILPQRFENSQKNPSGKYQNPGDLIVVCGGRVGADGIHGATFSSMELKDDALSTFVQIGDPYTQKKLTEFILAARDQGLYSSLTDNGAGGLSSSIGEMAQMTGGAKIQLQNALIKYPGLKNFEIMISESQERMTLAVPCENYERLKELAKLYEVELSMLGEFTSDGYLDVYDGEELVCHLDMDFMHNGLEQMQLKASFNPNEFPFPIRKTTLKEMPKSNMDKLQALLVSPNIASKKKWVAQYDHEVKAQTIHKPYSGKNQSIPSDSGVIDLTVHGGDSLISVANGLDTLYSSDDTYQSTHYAVDECLRNLLASGADFYHIALLDNFCWPDPIKSKNNPDGEHKLALLVRANHALREACSLYQTPLVSGKDSMKNDFRGLDHTGSEIKISSLPTLLISGIAKNQRVINQNFTQTDQLVYLVGKYENQIYRNHFYHHYYSSNSKFHPIDLDANLRLYKRFNQLHPYLEACHDISEGGAITALFEMCGEYGFLATYNLSEAQLYNEPTGSFIMAINPEDQNEFEASLSGIDYMLIGKTTADLDLIINNENLDFQELKALYEGVHHG